MNVAKSIILNLIITSEYDEDFTLLVFISLYLSFFPILPHIENLAVFLCFT